MAGNDPALRAAYRQLGADANESIEARKVERLQKITELAETLRSSYLDDLVREMGHAPDDGLPHSRTTPWADLPHARRQKWIRMATDALEWMERRV